jgi:hypothetical protein
LQRSKKVEKGRFGDFFAKTALFYPHPNPANRWHKPSFSTAECINERPDMNKIVAYSFLGLGFLLLVLGFYSYVDAVCDVPRALNDEPSDLSLCLAVAGLLSGITGAFGLATEKDGEQISRPDPPRKLRISGPKLH